MHAPRVALSHCDVADDRILDALRGVQNMPDCDERRRFAVTACLNHDDAAGRRESALTNVLPERRWLHLLC